MSIDKVFSNYYVITVVLLKDGYQTKMLSLIVITSGTKFIITVIIINRRFFLQNETR